MSEPASTQSHGVRVGVTQEPDGRRRVQVCAGTACVFAGSMKMVAAFEQEIEAAGLAGQVEVSIIGCHGLCSQGPLAVISGDETYYPKLKPKNVKRIVEEHLRDGRVADDLKGADTGEHDARVAHVGETGHE